MGGGTLTIPLPGLVGPTLKPSQGSYLLLCSSSLVDPFYRWVTEALGDQHVWVCDREVGRGLFGSACSALQAIFPSVLCLPEASPVPQPLLPLPHSPMFGRRQWPHWDRNVVADLGPEPGKADKKALPLASCPSILPSLGREAVDSQNFVFPTCKKMMRYWSAVSMSPGLVRAQPSCSCFLQSSS